MEKQVDYIIAPLKADALVYLVFSTNYTRVDDYISNIEKSMLEDKFKGTVIFDLLLNNGIRDRYYTAEFNGKKFNYNSFKFCDFVNQEVAAASSKFYLNHIEFIDNSFFPKAKKFVIKRELKKALDNVLV